MARLLALSACTEVKHSHLTDVDTTDMSAAWAQSSKVVQRLGVFGTQLWRKLKIEIPIEIQDQHGTMSLPLFSWFSKTGVDIFGKICRQTVCLQLGK